MHAKKTDVFARAACIYFVRRNAPMPASRQEKTKKSRTNHEQKRTSDFRVSFTVGNSRSEHRYPRKVRV